MNVSPKRVGPDTVWVWRLQLGLWEYRWIVVLWTLLLFQIRRIKIKMEASLGIKKKNWCLCHCWDAILARHMPWCMNQTVQSKWLYCGLNETTCPQHSGAWAVVTRLGGIASAVNIWTSPSLTGGWKGNLLWSFPAVSTALSSAWLC